MNENKVKEVVKECVNILDNSTNYEEGIQKVCDYYCIPHDEIFIPEEARKAIDVKGKSADELIDVLGYANNQTAIVKLFSDLQQNINRINTDLVTSSIASSTRAVNQNPQLHGFLFEEIHAAVFNMRARMAGKPYVAMVLKPRPGQTYAKNSIDILILNSKTHEKLQQYQLKCCATSDATIQAISNGDYHNQRLLVADGQAQDVKNAFPSKTVTTHLEYDGITSNSVTYTKAKELQNAIQSGKWDAINWGEYSNKELFYAGVQSLKTPVLIDVLMRTVIGVGIKIAGHTEDSWSDILKKNVLGVLDDTTKLGITTAIQISIKKGMAETVLAKLPSSEIYAVVSLAIDTVKEIVMVAEGKQDITEAIDNIAKKTVVAAAQVAGGAGGAALGTWIAGPIGAEVGRFVATLGCGILAERVYDFVEKKITETNDEVIKNSPPLHEKYSEKNLVLN